MADWQQVGGNLSSIVPMVQGTCTGIDKSWEDGIEPYKLFPRATTTELVNSLAPGLLVVHYLTEPKDS